jgi:hypothetical protein
VTDNEAAGEGQIETYHTLHAATVSLRFGEVSGDIFRSSSNFRPSSKMACHPKPVRARDGGVEGFEPSIIDIDFASQITD